MKITAVICCYNSEKRIVDTLRHLKNLNIPAEAVFEVIVVDNASTDNTAETVRRYWQFKTATLRVIPEFRPGLIHARRRGLAEAKGDIIAFIDDDNWVSSSYLESIHQRFSQNTNLGVWGCMIQPHTEAPAPDWFLDLSPYYAVTTSRTISGWTDTVVGAGMAIRRAVFESFDKAGIEFILSGRRGKAMTAGEDSEICFLARLFGWKIYYDANEKIRHFIPVNRLSPEYALRLLSGIGDSSCPLGYYRSRQTTGIPISLLRATYTWANSLYRGHCLSIITKRNFASHALMQMFRHAEHSWRCNSLTRICAAERNIRRAKKSKHFLVQPRQQN